MTIFLHFFFYFVRKFSLTRNCAEMLAKPTAEIICMNTQFIYIYIDICWYIICAIFGRGCSLFRSISRITNQHIHSTFRFGHQCGVSNGHHLISSLSHSLCHDFIVSTLSYPGKFAGWCAAK